MHQAEVESLSNSFRTSKEQLESEVEKQSHLLSLEQTQSETLRARIVEEEEGNAATSRLVTSLTAEVELLRAAMEELKRTVMASAPRRSF
jgi:hypothetical protein